jgi:NAD(P)H-dependent flavin oxidoreductase YrpB (nitropropane dioxygenase family)
LESSTYICSYHSSIDRCRSHILEQWVSQQTRGGRWSEKVPVVVFFWDDPPDEWLSRPRAADSHIWFQVGSVVEARAARRRDPQALIVQGSEAGGHKRAGAATFSLLPAVTDVMNSVPVVAAGGIGNTGRLRSCF